MDTSRQWAQTTTMVRPDHRKRYELAARYASGRVLDAACGCGYGSKILLNAKAQLVVGVDHCVQAIHWAEEHFQGPQFLQAKIEDEPWTGRFETVVSLETIEHLQEPKPALQAFRRTCIGILIASVPNEELHPFSPGRYKGDDSPHYRHYRPQEFEDLLKACGFRVTERFCQKDKKGDIQAGSDGMFIVYIAE